MLIFVLRIIYYVAKISKVDIRNTIIVFIIHLHYCFLQSMCPTIMRKVSCLFVQSRMT